MTPEERDPWEAALDSELEQWEADQDELFNLEMNGDDDDSE